MPSQDDSSPGISRLPLENTCLHGGKNLSQPRFKLALNLPGSQWLNPSPLCQPGTQALKPQKLSLVPSWEEKARNLPESSIQSLLSSSYSLTSNPILDSEHSLTSSQSLRSKLSLATSATDHLSSSILTSKPTLTSSNSLMLNSSYSSLSTNLSLPSTIAATSKPSVFSKPANIDSHLTPKHVTTVLSPQSNVTSSTSSGNNFDLSKQEKLLPFDGFSNLKTTLGVIQKESRALVSQEDKPSCENLASLPVCHEEEPLFDAIIPQPPMTFEIMPSTQAQHPSIRPPATKPQTVTQESTTFHDQQLEKLIHKKKMALVSAACCSLVNGPKYSDSSDPTRTFIWDLCEEVAKLDPEFVLKVALYTRQELNIRSTANFLLALSALIPACRPHLRRYFCASTQLPSDWMEVPRLYQSLLGTSEKLVPLPSCLCKALTIKFKEFSEYQLAKYNTRRQRGKHGPKRRVKENVNVQREVRVGKVLKCIRSLLQAIQQKFDAPPPSPPCKKTKDSFSLKNLIRRVHISKPANHVMSLLGCKYPKDMQSFSRSGLEGPWQSERAGCRMKLKQPETWERELSQKGNTAPVWEKLLDNHQVPFMALLRNVRSLIRAGVSKRHHKQVTDRLSNQNAVIKSRLFPFRFLSAYKVIRDLELQRLKAESPFPSNMNLLLRILKREGKANSRLRSQHFNRRLLRACLGVPAVYQLLKREKKALKKARSIKLDHGVLQSYKNALEEAVQISARHNIPPLPGRTVIIFSVSTDMYHPCHGAKELNVDTEDPVLGSSKNPPTLLEVGLLLALMVKGNSESTQLVLCEDEGFLLADTSSGSILQNLSNIKDQALRVNRDSGLPFQSANGKVDYLLELLRKRTKVDTLMVFGAAPLEPEFRSVMKHYRKEVNTDCLCVSVLPAGSKSEDNLEECNDVTLCGFSEQILRYVSERGTSRLIDHVEKVNERFSVPEDPEIAKKKQMTVREIITSPPKQRWRSVRVFISSTFRDMHGERDLLISRVMPELRVRAAQHFISLEEVDLRWGITEEEAKKDRQLSLCLSEVSRSHIFIGILGERYGHIPTSYSVPLLPEFQWIQTYPPERSITELEMIQFLQNCDPSMANYPKAFIYLRDPAVLRSVPKQWISDFAAETQDAEIRVSNLKNTIRKHPAVRSFQYTSQWGGERDGKPFVTGLGNFEARVLEDIWQVMERDFINEPCDTSGEDEEQEGFQEWQERQCCARNKLISSTCARILSKTGSSPPKGQMFLICGEPSQGKTVFMAVLVKELRLAASSVIYHFGGASPESQGVEHMLTRVCKQLCLSLQREIGDITSYRALKEEFQYLLLVTSRSLKRNETLTVLIDEADLLHGRAGELSSDWIPEHLPPRVNLVLTVTEGSSLSGSLRCRKETVLIPLGSLEASDRAELVRQRLAVYGKKLEESSFNNQMRLLLIKKGTRDPLYLTVACEELRAKAVFEKLSDDIQKLPVSLAPLMQRRLQSLEDEHGTTMVTIALTAICLSRKGLQERDLLRILSTSNGLCSVYTAKWSQILAVASRAENLPMTTFSLLLRGLRSVLGLWTFDPRLHLRCGLIRDAVEKRYLSKPEVIRAVHLLMAAQFWTVCFPDSEPFPVPPAECLSELTHHLLCSQQLQTLSDLLLNLPFLKTHATLGLLPHLCQVYSRYAEAVSENESSEQNREHGDHHHQLLGKRKEFIQRYIPVLSQNPSLLYQLALNEPCESDICIQAQNMVCARNRNDGQLLVMWNNKPQTLNICSSKALKVVSTPACAVLGSGGKLVVVGMSDGSLHFINTDTGEDLRILQSSCDGVSTCALITTDLLCVASYDGTIEIWNIQDGCRIHRTEAHRRQVTGCCVSADRRQLLTCSLDSQLKLWETSRGTLLSSTSLPSPLNCVELHPSGHVVAVGSWDGNITVLRLDNWKRSAILGGGSSVRAVSFSLEGNMLISGSLDGSVSLWAWEAHVQLAHFTAHNGSTLTTSLFSQGEHVVTGGEDGRVQVWSGGLGKLHGQVCTEADQSSALCLAISPNKHSVAVGCHSNSVFIYRVDSGDRVSECSFADVAVRTLVWLTDSKLATGSSDNLVRIWNVTPGVSQCQLVLHGHQRPVQALAVSSKLLASASEDVSVCLWTLEDLLSADSPPAPLSVLRGHTAAVTCCSFSHDGRLLATGGQDRTVLCWDVSLNPPVVAYSLLSCHRDWVSGCVWTNDNKLVSCSGDGSVCLWDVTQQQCLVKFAGHQSAVSSAACMGERVLTAGRDGYLKVWNLSGVEITAIPAHCNQINQIAAYWDSEESRGDADLMVYTAGSDGSVLKWCPLQMEKVQTLCGHGGAVITSAAAPQCDTIVSAALDGSVRVWGKPCRDEHPVPTSHSGAVTAIAWSPDGDLVVTGGETGDLIVWEKQRVVLKLQCSELCISSIIFTTKRSFCVISNDQKVSRWLLFPEKGGSLRTKNAYSVEMESLVVKATLISAKQVELITLSGKRFIIEPKTGSLQDDDSASRSMAEPRALPSPEQLQPGDIHDAFEPDIGVCDTDGGLWLPSSDVKASDRKTAVKWKRIPMHNSPISCLCEKDGYVVSASADRAVKIWERSSFKQMGLFHCEGAVTCLSLSPKLSNAEEVMAIACGDQYGNVYLLSCL